MPTLNWASKTQPAPIPASLKVDSVVYPRGAGYPGSDPESHLFLGDNLAVMSALLPDYEGKIDLIYADPPFFTNRAYPTRVGRGEDSRRPQEWRLAEGYPDHWRSIDAYLDMLYPRLALMHRLLSSNGTLYLHLDWHADAYAKLLLDELFGSERLLNEIVWCYHGPSPIRSAFNRKHDIILAYTRSEGYTFNPDAVRQPYDPSTVKTFNASPKAGFGKMPDLKRGKVPEDWWYFPVVARLHNERTGYPTQKPQALLERIILASSNPGDLVADFFCGSGTTPLVAARHARRFLASDIAFRAVHTTRNRLVASQASPFTIQLESQACLNIHSIAYDPACFSRSEEGVLAAEDTVENLDYWEIDPAYDGKIYRSTNQAVRPLKKGAIAKVLPLPQEATGVSSGPVAIRMVTIEGELQQVLVPGRSSQPG